MLDAMTLTLLRLYSQSAVRQMILRDCEREILKSRAVARNGKAQRKAPVIRAAEDLTGCRNVRGTAAIAA